MYEDNTVHIYHNVHEMIFHSRSLANSAQHWYYCVCMLGVPSGSSSAVLWAASATTTAAACGGLEGPAISGKGTYRA